MKMISELLRDGRNTTSESNSFRMKSTVGTITMETNKTDDRLRRSVEEQTITTADTTNNSGSTTTKQLMYHRFSVNNILSPLNNIG